MIARDAAERKALVVALQTSFCALPLTHVIEMMRPLPFESVAGAPPFVQGVAIIRGIPTPVVDLGFVLGTPSGSAGRFVTLRAGGRQVALSVNAVVGVRDIVGATIEGLAPLLGGASKDVIETIGTLDEQMLMVLQEGWELPAEVWQALTPHEAAL